MRIGLMMTAAATAMGLALGGCHSSPATPLAGDGVGALGATVRVNPNPAAPWAAYFTLQGGAEPHVLTGVSVRGAERAELHESKMEGGVMTMATITRLEIPAREQVVLRSGGKHVMLFGVTEEARRMGTVTLTLHFDGGGDLPVELAFPPQVAGAASGAPASGTVATSSDAPIAAPVAPVTPVAPAAPAAGEHSGH